MKRILTSLFLALTLAAGAVAQDTRTLRQKSDDANDAYWACITSGGRDCSETLQAASIADEALHKAIAAQLHANTAAIEQATAGILAATANINAYAACRHNRRWFQVWKPRCELR